MSTGVNVAGKALGELEMIGFVTGSLFQVSAGNISRLRDAFEKNRVFYTDVSDLYTAVKKAARMRGQDVGADPGKVRKAVSVAFTSNTHLYGSVNFDLMRAFVEHMQSTDRDFIVIGRTGQAYMRARANTKEYASVAFALDEPSDDEMGTFLASVAHYEDVYIFYPAFVNVFRQDIRILDLTHTQDADSSSIATGPEYIFEPELSSMIDFFETRIRRLLFRRAMLESQLARTASRLIFMHTAEEKASTALTRAKRDARRYDDLMNDMRLLEAFSFVQKWKR